MSSDAILVADPAALQGIISNAVHPIHVVYQHLATRFGALNHDATLRAHISNDLRFINVHPNRRYIDPQSL